MAAKMEVSASGTNSAASSQLERQLRAELSEMKQQLQSAENSSAAPLPEADFDIDDEADELVLSPRSRAARNKGQRQRVSFCGFDSCPLRFDVVLLRVQVSKVKGEDSDSAAAASASAKEDQARLVAEMEDLKVILCWNRRQR